MSIKLMQCQATVMLPYFSFACCLNGIQINEMALIPPVIRGYTQQEARVMLPHFSFVCCCLTGSLFIMSTLTLIPPVISGYTLKKIALWSGISGTTKLQSFYVFSSVSWQFEPAWQKFVLAIWLNTQWLQTLVIMNHSKINWLRFRFP